MRRGSNSENKGQGGGKGKKCPSFRRKEERDLKQQDKVALRPAIQCRGSRCEISIKIAFAVLVRCGRDDSSAIET